MACPHPCHCTPIDQVSLWLHQGPRLSRVSAPQHPDTCAGWMGQTGCVLRLRTRFFKGRQGVTSHRLVMQASVQGVCAAQSCLQDWDLAPGKREVLSSIAGTPGPTKTLHTALDCSSQKGREGTRASQ